MENLMNMLSVASSYLEKADTKLKMDELELHNYEIKNTADEFTITGRRTEYYTPEEDQWYSTSVTIDKKSNTVRVGEITDLHYDKELIDEAMGNTRFYTKTTQQETIFCFENNIVTMKTSMKASVSKEDSMGGGTGPEPIESSEFEKQYQVPAGTNALTGLMNAEEITANKSM